VHGGGGWAREARRPPGRRRARATRGEAGLEAAAAARAEYRGNMSKAPDIPTGLLATHQSCAARLLHSRTLKAEILKASVLYMGASAVSRPSPWLQACACGAAAPAPLVVSRHASARPGRCGMPGMLVRCHKC
jgi:hypothetical protein